MTQTWKRSTEWTAVGRWRDLAVAWDLGTVTKAPSLGKERGTNAPHQIGAGAGGGGAGEAGGSAWPLAQEPQRLPQGNCL